MLRSAAACKSSAARQGRWRDNAGGHRGGERCQTNSQGQSCTARQNKSKYSKCAVFFVRLQPVTVTVEAYLAQLSANVRRHWLRHTLGLGDHTAQTRGHETRPGGLEARRTYVVQTVETHERVAARP